MGAWTRLHSAPSRRGQGRGRPGLAAPAPRRGFRPHPAPAVVTSWAPAAAPWRPVAERGAEWTVKAVGRKGAREQPAERGVPHGETPGNLDQLSRNSAADLPPAPERGSSRPPRPSAVACSREPVGRARRSYGGRGAARESEQDAARKVGGAERSREGWAGLSRARGWAERSRERWAGPGTGETSGGHQKECPHLRKKMLPEGDGSNPRATLLVEGR